MTPHPRIIIGERKNPLLHRWLSEMGHYEALDAFDKLNTSLHTPITDDDFGDTLETTHAREAFLRYLHNTVLPRTPSLRNGLVTMESLLDKHGLALYHAALAEEASSLTFQKAVFNKAIRHYPGLTWSKRLVLWVGGPSASGKTRASSAMIEHLATQIPKDPSDKNNGNFVVSIDGSIEREVSQMRNVVLQVALSQAGCKGIRDLHKHSNTSVKKKNQTYC